MPVEIRVPALGESVVEATIAQWLKSPGDTVKAGDPLVELETDKVNVEVPAEVSGVLGVISKQAGDTVGVGEVLGSISDSANGTAPAVAAPAAETTSVPTPPQMREQPASTETNGSSAHSTPTAAAMAAANNVDLKGVTGTLPGGRIGKEDVARATTPAPVAPVAAPPVKPPVATAPAAPSGRPEERIKLSRRRQVIAANLLAAQHNAAMLTTFNEVDMTAVMDVRKRRKDAFKEKFGANLGFMSFFTKAVVGALKQYPYVNSEIQGDEVVLKKYYDIGIAVGLEEGLVVPVVRDADRRTFAGIEKEIAALAGKARENKLSLADLTGGTFTITNGGVYGSLMSTPILNAPQVGILGMHNIVQRPIVVNGEIAIRPMMYIALSYDHRIIDGSTAVRFLVKIKELIEDPEALLLES